MSLLIDGALVLIGISILLALIRVMLGPTGADRIVASDVVVANVIAAVALATMKLGTELFLDAVLVITLLAFVGTAAFARYLLRDVVSPEEAAAGRAAEGEAGNEIEGEAERAHRPGQDGPRPGEGSGAHG